MCICVAVRVMIVCFQSTLNSSPHKYTNKEKQIQKQTKSHTNTHRHTLANIYFLSNISNDLYVHSKIKLLFLLVNLLPCVWVASNVAGSLKRTDSGLRLERGSSSMTGVETELEGKANQEEEETREKNK